MRISRYEIFVKVVECGSISKAAEQLGYTQSAISQSIAALEEELNISLLDRSRYGVSLSPDGKLLFPDIMAIYNSENNLSNRVASIHNVLVGTIRIGTFTSVSCHILPEVIYRFTQKHPGVSFELMHGYYHEIENWLMAGLINLGFLKLPCSDKLEVLPLEQERLVAILPLEHTLATLDVVPIECLCSEKFILLEEGYNEEIMQIFSSSSISPNIAYRTQDDYTIMAFVERGLGVGILPERVLARSPYHVAIRPLNPPFFRSVGIAMKKEALLPTAARIFLEDFKCNYLCLM